jgi:Glycosyltransferase family 87
VPLTDPTRKLALISRTTTLILLLLILFLAAFAAARPLSFLQGSDFPHFYCAARMLAEGHGHQLFDADLQRQYQARYAGRVGTLYSHPPFEALLYLAVAWLPLRYAHFLWSFLTMTLLAAGAARLARDALPPWNWRLMFAASLTFVPVLVCVLQGQDSLLLLLLLVLAFTEVRRGSGFAAGCWLALGLFKFQLVLPLVLVMVLIQKRGFRIGLAKGFSLTALALAGVSVAISGWSVLTLYPKFLLHFKDQPLGGMAPQAMANLRGLTYFFFRTDDSAWAVACLSILSAAALVKTLTVWKDARLASDPSTAPTIQNNDEFDLAFANTVLFALLVSYHLNPHDLTLLLLPVALLLHRMFAGTTRCPRAGKWMTAGLLGILFLPPLHLWALRANRYALVSLPLLALFLTSAYILRTSRTP